MERREGRIKTRNKQKNNRKFFNFVIVLVILSSVYFTTTFIKQSIESGRVNEQLDSLLKKEEELNKEIVDLKKTYDNADSPDFVERIAREKLGMIKSKEYIIKE